MFAVCLVAASQTRCSLSGRYTVACFRHSVVSPASTGPPRGSFFSCPCASVRRRFAHQAREGRGLPFLTGSSRFRGATSAGVRAHPDLRPRGAAGGRLRESPDADAARRRGQSPGEVSGVRCPGVAAGKVSPWASFVVCPVRRSGLRAPACLMSPPGRAHRGLTLPGRRRAGTCGRCEEARAE